MSGPCLDAGRLARYVMKELDPAAMLQAARHVAECSACAERARLLRRVEQTGVAAIAEVLDRVAARVEELEKEPLHRWPLLVREERFRDPDLARRLIALAIEERGRDTGKAILLSECATAVADRLPADAPDVKDIQFDAWKIHSALLREAGRFSECSNALDRVMEIAGQTADVELSRAIIVLSRALMYAEPDIWKPEKALRLLDDAEAVFATRDRERLRTVLVVRAMVLWRRGEVKEARRVWQEVLARTPSSDEAEYAAALVNVAQATLDCGLIDEAETLLNRAHAVYTRLESAAHIGRCEWIGALIERARGHHERELSLALRAMAAFAQTGMVHLHVRVGLVAVHALVATGEDAAALELARKLSEQSIALDQSEPHVRHTRTAEALAYLRDVAQRLALSTDVVEAIETYVARITHQHPVPFVPPAPLDVM